MAKILTDEELAAKARQQLSDFFDIPRGRKTPEDVSTARVAGSFLATRAREKQAAGAADALNFMIARELSGDKTQLEKFLTAAMPNAPVVRALPGKKES
jgi:hypothetical protein